MDNELDAAALWAAFYADDVAEPELVTLLSHHFQSGRMDPGSDVVELAKAQDGEAALRLHYTDGSLSLIEPGPTLLADDVEAIRVKVENAVLADDHQQVGRQVFFSIPEVVGWWRYRDVFQLVPAPPDAPRPGFVIALHPFVAEIAYPATDDHLVRLVRERLGFWELGLLLGLLLHGRIHVQGDRKPHHWVLDGSGDGFETKYLNEGYSLDGFTFITDTFSDMSDVKPMPEIPDVEYYASQGISVEQKMEVPHLMTTALDRYFDLGQSDRERFLRACYWLQHATRVRREAQRSWSDARRNENAGQRIGRNRTHNPLVAGSNPAGPTNESPGQGRFSVNGRQEAEGRETPSAHRLLTSACAASVDTGHCGSGRWVPLCVTSARDEGATKAVGAKVPLPHARGLLNRFLEDGDLLLRDHQLALYDDLDLLDSWPTSDLSKPPLGPIESTVTWTGYDQQRT